MFNPLRLWVRHLPNGIVEQGQEPFDLPVTDNKRPGRQVVRQKMSLSLYESHCYPDD
jgi:hypothetical protein